MAFNGEGPLIKRQRTDAESGQHRVSCLEDLYRVLDVQKHFVRYIIGRLGFSLAG